jgi:toxin ParE1/3/4
VRVIWSPLALERVADITTWIAQDRPAAAARTVEDLFAAVDRVSQFPRVAARYRSSTGQTFEK